MASSALGGFLSFRSDRASRAAAVSFTSNFVLMVLKFAVGIMTGSIAVLSDAIDSAEDCAASTFAFLSIRYGNQPADEEHPYGHGKAESIAAAGQALLIAAGATYIVFRAVQRLMDGGADIETRLALIALGITAAVNVCVAQYVGRAARDTGSMALRADTRHLWTNVVQAIAVFTALALVAITGNTIFDPIMALLLAVYLLWTAAQVFMTALAEMLDARLPADEEQLVADILRQDGEVRSFHDLRTRKSGRQRYIDVHVEVNPAATISQAHDLSERIETVIRDRLHGAVVTIHLEPEGESMPVSAPS